MLPLYKSKEFNLTPAFAISNLAVIPNDRNKMVFNKYWVKRMEGSDMDFPFKVGDVIEFISLSVTWQQKTTKHPYWIKKAAKYAKIDKIDLDNDLLSVRPLNEQSFSIQLSFADTLPYLKQPSDKTMKILFGKP